MVMINLAACVFALLTGLLPQLVMTSGEMPSPVQPRAQAPAGTSVTTVAVGSSRLVVRVSSQDGRPVASAQVNLFGVNTEPGVSTSSEAYSVSRVGFTDDQGQFVIDALPAGRYRVSASHAQFDRAAYRRSDAAPNGGVLVVASGQRLEAPIVMNRLGSLSGQVVDDRGEIVAGAAIYVTQIGWQGDPNELGGNYRTSTDDRGTYRVGGIPQGDYIISATPNASSLQSRLRIDAENVALQAAMSTRRAEGSSSSTVQTVVPSVVPVPAPTYYPDAPTLLAAQHVHVDVGEDRLGVDITTHPFRAARIDGKVTGPSALLYGALARLRYTDLGIMPAANLFLPSARVGLSGTFRIWNVEPGTYDVEVETADAEKASAGDPDRIMWGRVTVTVSAEPSVDVTVPLTHGRSMSGVLLNAGQPVGAGLQVYLMSIIGKGEAGRWWTAKAFTDANGHFVIRGILPGTYQVASFLSDYGTAVSAIVDGEDTLERPLVVTGDRDYSDVVVELRPSDAQVAHLTGRLTDGSGAPVSDGTVVLVRSGAADLSFLSGNFMTRVPGWNGEYEFAAKAGEYRLLYVPSAMVPRRLTEPSVLDPLLKSSSGFVLAAGAHVVRDLRTSQ